MKYYFTFAIDGYWDTAVESVSLEKAKAVAKNGFDYADFSEASLAEGKISNLILNTSFLLSYVSLYHPVIVTSQTKTDCANCIVSGPT